MHKILILYILVQKKNSNIFNFYSILTILFPKLQISKYQNYLPNLRSFTIDGRE